MTQEAAPDPKPTPTPRLPDWRLPCVLLAFPPLFYYFAHIGAVYMAMIFGFSLIPVLLLAMGGCIAVLVNAIRGRYRNRWSILGVLAWVCVGVITVASVIGIAYRTPELGMMG